MRRSIFVHIGAATAALISQKIGAEFEVEVRHLGDDELLAGRTLLVRRMDCGTLILVKNDGLNICGCVCPGWKYLPIWISDCGNSGVLCLWKDLDAKRIIDEYETEQAMERFCAEVDTAMIDYLDHISPIGWAN